MHRLAGCPVAVFDRDHVISVSGAAKKEWNARRVSPELEDFQLYTIPLKAYSGKADLRLVVSGMASLYRVQLG